MIEDIEDILNIEVPLVEVPHLSKAYGARVAFLDGSVYPFTNTIKDLRNAETLLRQRHLDEAVYVDISWGNSARSMAVLAGLEEKLTNCRRIVVTLIPEGYIGLKEDLEESGCIVVEKSVRELERKISDDKLKSMAVKELKERGIECSCEKSNIFIVEEEKVFRKAYNLISDNITEDTDYLFVPFGTGGVAMGMIQSLLTRYGGSIDRMPKIVCVETENKVNIRGKNLTHDKSLTKHSTFRNHIEELSRRYNGKIEFVTVSEDERDGETCYEDSG